MHLAKLHITPELISDLLHLPTDTTMVNIQMDWNMGRPIVVATIHSPEFETVVEGADPPLLNPSWTTTREKCVTCGKRKVEFMGWR